MPTSIAWTVEPLVEAEAVVEAEWIRILEEQSADPNDAITRERPALRRVPIGTAVAAATDPRPGLGLSAGGCAVAPRQRGQARVWPTQRSPPHPGCDGVSQCVRTIREVMLFRSLRTISNKFSQAAQVS